MKQTKLPVYLMLLATLSAGSCSNEDTPDTPYNPSNDPEAVELGITAGVALTKSAINQGTDDTNFKSIAVYAVGPTTSYTTGNNYALYTKSGNWTNTGTDKIYLTNETATIYGYHPAYKPNNGVMETSGTALKIKEASPSANATIDISVFESSDSGDANNKYPTDINNADKIYSSTWSENTANKGKIISAPGEVDYMYAVKSDSETDQPTASNGKKASGTPTANANEVSLKMKHALAMVSFRIYNDGTYANTGSLTKIKLSNTSTNKDLSKGTNPTMKIKDGSITENAAIAANYYRFIDGGYTIIKKGNLPSATIATSEDEAKQGAKKFSILVLPSTTASAANIQATFTIDGAEYTVPLGSAGTVNWAKGTNTLYTAKLSGKELTLSSITVEGWGNGATTGELPVN